MPRQKYIYPSTELGELAAIYSTPEPEPGVTTVQAQATNNGLLYDRVISTTLHLPYQFDEIKIQPNELAVSTSIFISLNKLYQNFIYIHANSFISSNILPGNYVGYFAAASGSDPEFFEYDRDILDTHLPSISASDLSNISEYLDELVDGIWVRDDSPVTTPLSGTNHVGFLLNSKALTVVKMPAKAGPPLHASYFPWKIVKQFTTVDETKAETNTLNYTNLAVARMDNDNNLHILDKGNATTGGARAVIYKYDVSGFITTKNIIESNKKFLLGSIGDVNYVTNVFDIIAPVSFDFDSDNNLIVFDEHDYTFKKFDSRLNYVDKYTRRTTFFKGAKGAVKQYIGIADLVIDRETNDIYVLTPSGYILIFDSTFELKSQLRLNKDDSNQSQSVPDDVNFNHYYGTGKIGNKNAEIFKTLDFSKNEPNVYYIISDSRIIKRFKTQDADIGYFSFLDNKIGREDYREYPIFLSILKDARVTTNLLRDEDDNPVEVVDENRTYTYDQIYVYSDTIDLTTSSLAPYDFNPTAKTDILIGNRHFLSFKEVVNLEKTILEEDYSIYDIKPELSISFKEYSSNIIYNKALYKVIWNHLQYLHQLRARFAGKYNTTGSFVFNGIRYIDEVEYSDIKLTLGKDNYIGVNEYFTSTVINRCLEQIYNLQNDIINLLQVKEVNTWPLEENSIAIEPYLYTGGGEYLDVDEKNYIGYYYSDLVNNTDIVVIGRRREDGEKDDNDNPASHRYLTAVTT